MNIGKITEACSAFGCASKDGRRTLYPVFLDSGSAGALGTDFTWGTQILMQTITRQQHRLAKPVVRPRVERCAGSLEGGIAVFRGIPYAGAHVGKLRFRPPAPRRPRNGLYDATRFGPTVHQLFVMASDASISAAAYPPGGDCLNLNVWTVAQGGDGKVVMGVRLTAVSRAGS